MSFAFMPIYTGDYLRDTRHLTPEEHGVYLLFLMHCWDSKGPVALDERHQAGICNARSAGEVASMKRVLEEFFTPMVDGWYNKRMTEELARWEAKSSAYREAGLKSAKVRKARSAMRAAAAQPRLNRGLTVAGIPTPTPNPTPNPKENPRHPSGALAGSDQDRSRQPVQRRIVFDYQGGQLRGVREDDLERWQEAYPAIAVPLEVKAAAEWLRSNPMNRKSNVERFLVNWLKRAQDRAGRVKA